MKPEECLGMLSEKGCGSKGGTTSGSLPGAEELDKPVDGVEERFPSWKICLQHLKETGHSSLQGRQTGKVENVRPCKFKEAKMDLKEG